MSTAYDTLEARFSQLHALEGASAILHWDAAVTLPTGAADTRAEQLAALAETTHQLLTAPDMAELLARAESDAASLNDWQQANLHEMQRRHLHASAVESTLVTALSKAGSACEHFWRAARQENDFAGFAKHFAPVLELVREMATAKADALRLSPYDALLDYYDPGLRQADIDPVFGRLAEFLPGFTTQAMEHQAAQPTPIAPTVRSATTITLVLLLMIPRPALWHSAGDPLSLCRNR